MTHPHGNDCPNAKTLAEWVKREEAQWVEREDAPWRAHNARQRLAHWKCALAIVGLCLGLYGVLWLGIAAVSAWIAPWL